MMRSLHLLQEGQSPALLLSVRLKALAIANLCMLCGEFSLPPVVSLAGIMLR